MLTMHTVSPIEYGRALATLPAAHPLQTIAWGELKSRWGWSMLPTLFTDNGHVVAAALVLKRTLPRTPFSMLYVPKGPTFDYQDALLREQVWKQLVAIGKRERAIVVKIDPDIVQATGSDSIVLDARGTAVTRELQAAGWQFSQEQIQFRNTVVFDMTTTEKALLEGMKAKTRYNIRLATKKGVTVRVGEVADYPMLAKMYAGTGARNQFGLRPAAYYLDVWRTLSQHNMLHVLIAEYEGVPLAAVFLVHYGDICLYMYGASANHERQRMPTYLLQWEAMQWAKEQGYQLYDMWGAPTHFDENDPLWGVWRFKKGFNGTVHRHIGAWDYPIRPVFYKLYAELLPRYINWLRNRSNDND